MGLLNRIFGTEPQHGDERRRSGPVAADAYALERYRYMLQTAPPETIEQAHAEAFEKLTPEQRQQVLAELAQAAPANERASIERLSSDDSKGIARVATRAEIRQPGIMERTLGAAPGIGSRGIGSQGMGSQGMGSQGMGSQGMGSQGMGSQGMGSQGMGFGANLLGSFAAAFAGSMVANAFFDALGGFDGFGATDENAAPGAHDANGAADGGDSLAGVGDQDVDAGADFDGDGFDGGDFDV